MKAILEIVSLVAENSSIPKEVGKEPLFFTYLSEEISSKILLTEFVEILFLLAIFFSESLVIKSRTTEVWVSREICFLKSTILVEAVKVLSQCLQ